MLIGLVLPLLALAAPPEAVARQKATMDELTQALHPLGLDQGRFMTGPEIAELRSLGWDEVHVQHLLEGLYAECLSEPEHCPQMAFHDDWIHESRGMGLFHLLGEIGTHTSLPLLRRLDRAGVFDVESAWERILERDMANAIETLPCKPPSDDEVARARDGLKDFVAIRAKGTSLVLERPTSQELDDLAYFLAAVSEEGVEVGETELPKPNPNLPRNAEREKLIKSYSDARDRGDLGAAANAARAYLATLGFPGPIRGNEEDDNDPTYGGPRYNRLMRRLARIDEELGDFEEAAVLYRTANPGGSPCGTGADLDQEFQVRGLIRSAEKAGHCRAAVAETLLSLGSQWEGYAPDSSLSFLYRPQRLRHAGFDVARLYRGALLTIYRDLPRGELETLFAKAPPELGKPALARLRRLGPEAWEFRVRAIEGWADEAQRDALPRLTELAMAGPPSEREIGSARARAVDALSALVQRPAQDPCTPKGPHDLESADSNNMHRKVHALSGCGQVLSAAERDALSRKLLPLLKSPISEFRWHGVRLLGAIASPVSLGPLRALHEEDANKAIERIERFEPHR